MNDKKIYRGARYLESPDGQYVIYQDGGDQDIFGNSSGYMHYALEYDNVYSRVFYGYKEIYTPQIEWYNDGFFVSYYCPELVLCQDLVQVKMSFSHSNLPAIPKLPVDTILQNHRVTYNRNDYEFVWYYKTFPSIQIPGGMHVCNC